MFKDIFGIERNYKEQALRLQVNFYPTILYQLQNDNNKLTISSINQELKALRCQTLPIAIFSLDELCKDFLLIASGCFLLYPFVLLLRINMKKVFPMAFH